MRSYTVCKTSILASYQAYIRPILDGEDISSVTTGHSRHRTTATQYCSHFNISYGITFLSRDCSLNQAAVFILSPFIQRTLAIDISDHFLPNLILSLWQLVRTAPVTCTPSDLVLYVVRIVRQLLYVYFMTTRDPIPK